MDLTTPIYHQPWDQIQALACSTNRIIQIITEIQVVQAKYFNHTNSHHSHTNLLYCKLIQEVHLEMKSGSEISRRPLKFQVQTNEY